MNLTSPKGHWLLFLQAGKFLTDVFQSVRLTIIYSLWISFTFEFSLCAWPSVQCWFLNPTICKFEGDQKNLRCQESPLHPRWVRTSTSLSLHNIWYPPSILKQSYSDRHHWVSSCICVTQPITMDFWGIALNTFEILSIYRFLLCYILPHEF